jgi:hypothetical protein
LALPAVQLIFLLSITESAPQAVFAAIVPLLSPYPKVDFVYGLVKYRCFYQNRPLLFFGGQVKTKENWVVSQ